jgi:hypothetical protein
LVRREQIEVDNEALDAEFNQTLSSLTMQGVDLSKIRGGRKGQQQLAQAVAMESANRVLTRRALDTLKAIATGTYVPPEERQQAEEASSQLASEGMDAETEAAAAPREKQDDTAPETQVLIEPTNVEESEPVVGDTSINPGTEAEQTE